MGILGSLTAGLSGQQLITGVATPLLSGESPLSTITLGDLYPGLDIDELTELIPLDRATAMAVPVIARGRNLICGTLAGMPLWWTKDGADLSPAQIDPGRPNAVTLAWTADAMLFHGRAWWLVTRRAATSDGGRPIHYRYVPESAVQLAADGYTPVKVNGADVDPADVKRIDALSAGLLSDSALTVRRARRTEAAAARASDNPVPSIELHQTAGEPMHKDKIRELLDGWAAARRGANGGVAYTNPSIETRTHGVAAEQLLINGRNASALDGARVLNLPAWAVDASVSGSSMTYSNVPSRGRELLDYTLHAYMDAITGRLGLDDCSPRGHGARLDPSRLLRGDFAARMTAGKTAIDAGIYTAEEIRQMDPDTPTNPERTSS